ncbi:MAG TPA: hypothetical protein VFG07_02895 [Thermoplasmata archaeon]|nr:hypothetical protein [Thermoplasmata archaeon]
MVDAADLEVNVLEFLHKSFGFERLAEVGGTEYAVYHRRETESETKLRPKIVRLFVVIPRRQLVLDPTEELVRVSPDGVTPGPRKAGEARESAADSTEFSEQGLDWHREKVPNGVAYLPKTAGPLLREPGALGALGLG